MSEAPKEAYPLTWPAGQSRTPSWNRSGGAFEDRGFGLIRDEMLAELRRMGAAEIILSSNIPVKLDGMPYANSREPDDGGIAVYFTRRKKPYVLACDKYNRAWKNLRALHRTIEALRAIERHGGSSLMEQAFTGFAALPSTPAAAAPLARQRAGRPGWWCSAHTAEPSWWDVLGVTPEAPLDEIEAAHERLALQHRPDLLHGDAELMARINRARDIAREERT